MNAVKRCQALIAATLLIGTVACGGDPLAKDAGKDLSIRATPGAVWVRNNSSASVSIEAVDALGGPVQGTWAVTGVTGPFTAVLDTAFQNTTAGALSTTARFVITPTAEGEGSVDIAGTGGSVNVPIRIAPDSLAWNVVFTTPALTGDSVIVPLNAPVTIATTAGIRFTSGTKVTMVTGPLARDTALFVPINFSIAADSTHLTFTPGPVAFRPGASTNRIRVTGIASASTPSLVTTARTAARIVVDQFDTAGSTRLALSTTTPALGQTITVTLPPEYRFSPNTVVHQFIDSVHTNGATLQDTTDGLAPPAVLSVSADSGTLTYVPAPAARGKPRFTNLRVRNNAAAWSFAARASGSYTVPALTSVNTAFSTATPTGATTFTATMPANFKFRPSSQATVAGGYNPIIIGVSADSTVATILAAPGQTGALTYSGVLFAPIPSLSLSLPSSTTVAATAAVADLGTDDFLVDSSTVFHVSAPTVVGTSTGFFDAPSFTGADNQQDGGIAKEQDYILSFANAGVYHITLNWTNGADVDLFLTNFAFSADLGHSFLGAGIPEAIDFTATAGQRIVLSINMFAGTIPTSLRVQVRRTS